VQIFNSSPAVRDICVRDASSHRRLSTAFGQGAQQDAPTACSVPDQTFVWLIPLEILGSRKLTEVPDNSFRNWGTGEGLSSGCPQSRATSEPLLAEGRISASEVEEEGHSWPWRQGAQP
jgi:hypothetical protein